MKKILSLVLMMMAAVVAFAYEPKVEDVVRTKDGTYVIKKEAPLYQLTDDLKIVLKEKIDASMPLTLDKNQIDFIVRIIYDEGIVPARKYFNKYIRKNETLMAGFYVLQCVDFNPFVTPDNFETITKKELKEMYVNFVNEVNNTLK